MSTHNVCFHAEIRKILSGYTCLSGAMILTKDFCFSMWRPHVSLLMNFTQCTLGKIFSRQHIGKFFLFFHRKQDLTFDANCLQFA